MSHGINHEILNINESKIFFQQIKYHKHAIYSEFQGGFPVFSVCSFQFNVCFYGILSYFFYFYYRQIFIKYIKMFCNFITLNYSRIYYWKYYTLYFISSFFSDICILPLILLFGKFQNEEFIELDVTFFIILESILDKIVQEIRTVHHSQIVKKRDKILKKIIYVKRKS